MLRLLFISAALLPIALVPWLTAPADALDVAAPEDVSYAEAVRAPSIEALQDCETEDLPVFFHDGYVTTHSAEFIAEGVDAADGCGDLSVTIIPVLPSSAAAEDIAMSVERTSELRELLRVEDVAVHVAEKPVSPETDALYVNGRAAILRIDAKQDVAGAVERRAR